MNDFRLPTDDFRLVELQLDKLPICSNLFFVLEKVKALFYRATESLLTGKVK